MRILLLIGFGAFLLVVSTGGAGGQTVEDDHGNTFDTATPVELGSSIGGRIDPGEDRDVFKFDLSDATGPTDLWVYTVGPFDTYGGLYNSTGTPITFNDDGFLHNQAYAFSIRSVVAPGVYYVVAVSFYGEPGDYTLRSQAITEPGSTVDTAKPMSLGSHDGGTIDTPDDVDYFRLDFTESKHAIIHAVSAGISNVDATLLDADGKEISANIWSVRNGVQINEDFEPGTYYLRVLNPLGAFLDDTSFRASPYAVVFVENTAYAELLDVCSAETAALEDPQISDPLFACQWHLRSPEWQDINVAPAWADGVKGEGVNVAVVDDGMDHAHEDLKDNVDFGLSFNYSTGGNDIYNRLQHHGTHVTGMIAARDNDVGVRGVAPQATVYGYNLLSGFNLTSFNILNALSRNGDVTAVSNNSWGSRDGPGLSASSSFSREVIEHGITAGYNGKGVFYVFSGGNGHLLGDNSNFDEYLNNYGVTAVCSVHSGGSRAGYSETGANLWVCAPSNDRPRVLGGVRGILTTENSDRYHQDFGGTSASVPIVSGVAALTRAANPDLTWRDMKLILAASAQKNDPGSPGWEDGALMHPVSSSDRYHFNHEYGFGVVNAGGAVDLAKRWSNLPALQETTVWWDTLDVEIPDAPVIGEPTTFTQSITVDTDIEFTEFVEVIIDFRHDSFRDLEILLESPAGAVSKLAVPFDTYGGVTYFSGGEFIPLYGSFQLGSAKHLGEDPNGEWKLHVTDHIRVAGGTFVGFGMTVYGHERAPSSVTIDTVRERGEALDVSWSAPDEAGDSEIISYDLRYILTDADETDLTNWAVITDVWNTGVGGELEYAVTGLENGTQYDLQVRATNGSGAGLWSETVTGTPMFIQCDVGNAVRDKTNIGLLYDCQALLDARDTLAGSSTLNWSVDVPIRTWDGVTLSGKPQRVTKLDLKVRGLGGSIPASLGRLDMLDQLNLRNNELTGNIPVELGNLKRLKMLMLHNNDLAGPMPDLGSLSNLNLLWLSGNDLGTGEGFPEWLSSMDGLESLSLWGTNIGGPIPDLSGMTGLSLLKLQNTGLTGEIPASLGALDNLSRLYLHVNSLTGEIPKELGDLSSLTTLWLHENRLSGNIPSELGNLSDSLTQWRLSGNMLTGCVPSGLAAVADNDMAELGLPVCP